MRICCSKAEEMLGTSHVKDTVDEALREVVRTARRASG